MYVTFCGRFRPDEGAVAGYGNRIDVYKRQDEGAVAGYGNRIRVKSPAKWGVQIAGMIFQTRSST